MATCASPPLALLCARQANNTCGFNHAVGSAAASDEGAPRFVALETDAGHTAAFFDMDPREVQPPPQRRQFPVDATRTTLL